VEILQTQTTPVVLQRTISWAQSEGLRSVNLHVLTADIKAEGISATVGLLNVMITVEILGLSWLQF